VTAPNGSGLQPLNHLRGADLWRCARLVWHRAFGPIEVSRRLVLRTFIRSLAPTGRTSLAPTGRPIPAQGIALGKRPTMNQALKGRYIFPTYEQ
jgi:hypothetical protein